MPLREITDPELLAKLNAGLAAASGWPEGQAPFSPEELVADPVAVPTMEQMPQGRVPDEMWDGEPMRFAEGVLSLVPGAGEAASINPMGPPDTPSEGLAHGLGLAAGLGGTMAAAGPLTAPLADAIGAGIAAVPRYAPLAGLGRSLAQTVPPFMALGALEPGTPIERINRAAEQGSVAAEFSALGGLPGMGSMAKRIPAMTAYMTGRDVAGGEDIKTALPRNLGMAGGMEIGHLSGKSEGRPYFNDKPSLPPEMGVRRPYKTGKFEPVVGEEAVTEPLAKYLNGEIKAHELTAALRGVDMTEVSEQLGEFIEAGGVNDIGSNQTVGRHRRIREMANNEFNSPLSKGTVRVWEMLDRAKHKMDSELKGDMLGILERGGFKEGGKDYEALADYMRNYGKDGIVDPVKAAEILERATEPDKIAAAAPEFRAELDRHWQMREDIAVATKDPKPIEYRQNYWPSMDKIYDIKSPVEFFKQKTEPIKPGKADPDRNARIWSAREMPQTLTSGSAKELDPFKFFERMIGDTSKKVTHSAALSRGMAAAEAIEASGRENTADGLRRIVEAGYNSKRYGIAGSLISAQQATRGGQAGLMAQRVTKQQFNKAKYTMSVPFMTLRQWGSLGHLNAHGEITPQMWGEALARSTMPESGQKYADSYTGWMKNLEYGHLSREGAMGDVTSAGSLRPKKGIEKAPDAIRAGSEWAVNRNENWTGRIAVEMADLIAEKQGMPEADRAAFRSEVAGLTQSYYDALNRAEILNDPTMNLLWPAQSFALESFNSVYRDILKNQTLTNEQKTKRASNLMLFAAMSQMLQQYASSFKDDLPGQAKDAAKGVVNSFIPYAPQIAGTGSVGDGETYPANAIDDIGKMRDYLVEGDYTSALGEFAKNWVRFGAQANRVIGTNRMIERGKLSEEERLWGDLFGWGSTPSGKAYLREVKGYDKGDDEPNSRSRKPRQRRKRPYRERR